MFFPAFVCGFVSLFVNKITQKLWTDFDEISLLSCLSIFQYKTKGMHPYIYRLKLHLYESLDNRTKSPAQAKHRLKLGF